MPQAPQVPGLTPTQRPSGFLPNVDLPVPVDAFGGAVGQALQHMGADIEQGAGRIWDRAMQLQDIQNRTEVDNADAEFIKQTALKHAEFNAQVGQNAGPEALAQHIQDIEDIRTGIRNGLSNPMSQRMFNSTSLSTMGRYISNASNHSANEIKSAYRQGMALKQGTLGNELADDPDDPMLRARFRATSEAIGREKGLSEADIPTFVNNAESAVNLETANRMSEKNPLQAKDWIENAHSQGVLVGEQYDAAIKANERASYQIIPDQIATQVTADLKNQTDPTRTGATEQERIQQARDLAVQKFPDLPLMATEAERATRAAYNAHLGAVRDLNHRDMTLAGDILEGNYSPDGKAPTTMAEVKAAPGGTEMLSRITYSQQQRIKRGLLANSQGVYLPTQENTDLYHKIYGQLTSDDASVRAAAMDIFIPELQMPKAYRTVLSKLQDQLYKGTPQDPRIGEAMKTMAPSLEGMDKDDLAKFRGAFSLIILDRMGQEQNKRLPDKEIREIGARLLQTQPSGHWYTSDSRLFEQSIPSDVLDKVKKDAAVQGSVITDEQAQAEYVRQLYTKLKEAGTKSKQNE